MAARLIISEDQFTMDTNVNFWWTLAAKKGRKESGIR